MELCRDSLEVSDHWIAQGHVIVAEHAGVAAGVAAIAPDGPGYEVALFFVEPAMMGKGIGADLYEAMLALAARMDISRLAVLSDPNAAGFYEKMGARPVGLAPSDAIEGRLLPCLEVDIPAR
jgi:N-acetylglutamate synthase-like GNAT family acetyltransferase